MRSPWTGERAADPSRSPLLPRNRLPLRLWLRPRVCGRHVLRRLGAGDMQLLPYNPLGLAMYPQLGRPVPDLPSGFVKPEREKELLDTFREIVLALD